MIASNIKLQTLIVDTLAYIDHWDTINGFIGFGLVLSVPITILSIIFFCVASLETDANMQLTTKNKASVLFFISCFGMASLVGIGALVFTPTASTETGKLTLYTSQMIVDDQVCSFIKSLHETNADYRSNITIPATCVEKVDD